MILTHFEPELETQFSINASYTKFILAIKRLSKGKHKKTTKIIIPVLFLIKGNVSLP